MAQGVAGALLSPDMVQALDWVPAMIWVSDMSGACCHVNLAWREFTGRGVDDSVGDGWLDAMHPEDAHAWPATIRQAIAAQEPFTLECRLRRRDGRYRWLMKSGQPFYGGDRGQIMGMIGCCSDVTGQKQALEALRQATDKHRSVLSNLRDAVGIIENFLPAGEHTILVGQDDRLTPRQREILHLIARGFATREIASQLHVSTKTVESHRAQLMQRLNIHDVASLTRYAIRTGLVQPDY